MSVILSISAIRDRVWAAGPGGLFLVTDEGLEPVPQPQEQPTSCLALPERILVGGAPHGVAYRPWEPSEMPGPEWAEGWQAAWMDQVQEPVLCLAASPDVETSGLVLAGTDGGGVLRSTDGGRSWAVSNFGLENLTVLDLAWAPAGAGAWPGREVAFAATEDGIYRSPGGGRGWKRCLAARGVILSLAVSPDFHETGLALAGAEERGLLISQDFGHSFVPLNQGPRQVNALVVTPAGWLLSDDEQLWGSGDGVHWEPIPDSRPALTLAWTEAGLLAGDEEGVWRV